MIQIWNHQRSTRAMMWQRQTTTSSMLLLQGLLVSQPIGRSLLSTAVQRPIHCWRAYQLDHCIGIKSVIPHYFESKQSFRGEQVHKFLFEEWRVDVYPIEGTYDVIKYQNSLIKVRIIIERRSCMHRRRLALSIFINTLISHAAFLFANISLLAHSNQTLIIS